MRRELFHIGEFGVPAFGVMLVVGFAVALWIAKRRTAKWGMQPDQVYDAAVWAIFPGILGARIFSIAQNWSHYSQNLDELFSFRFEGMTSFGSFVFGGLGIYLWSRRAKVPMKVLSTATSES